MRRKKLSVGEQAATTALVTHEEGEYLDLAAGPMLDFEKALGGRNEFISALAIDGSEKIQELIRMLLDPRFNRKSLAYLARAVDISLTDLLRSYRNSMLIKAQMQAVATITAKLPAVVEDVMQRAAPVQKDCPACSGTGTQSVKPTKKEPNPAPAEVTCNLCRGKKTLWEMPDLDRQRLALELGELIKSPAKGPAIMQQFNMPGASAPDASTPAKAVQPGSFERMQQAVSDILYNRQTPTVIDVEPEATE